MPERKLYPLIGVLMGRKKKKEKSKSENYLYRVMIRCFALAGLISGSIPVTIQGQYYSTTYCACNSRLNISSQSDIICLPPLF